MIITETKRNTRPSTDVPFFNTTDAPELTAVLAGVAPLLESGEATYVKTLSDDELVQTTVATFNSLEAYNHAENTHTIALDNAYLNYVNSNRFPTMPDYTQVENRRAVYTQTGFTSPFTVTTVYTFPHVEPEDYVPDNIMAVFANSVESYPDGLSKRIDLILDENTVTLIHQYNDSADFTDNLYNDLFYVPQLAEKGVTRTITYSLVS